jgi:galactokinase/mevalonate kinase-like predicted kinase
MSPFIKCIITAGSQKQADSFDRLIRKRVEHGLYPREIDFVVYADPAPVGSGGATLLALERFRKESGGGDPINFFSNQNILIINAGGSDRNLPCFAPEGKPFIPLPVDSSSTITPVALDLQLNLFLKYPWTNGEILVSSGNVITDFDTLLLPQRESDICGFAMPVPFESGASHGVFKFDRTFRKVERYYQKADAAFLQTNAQLEGTIECALDMGLLSISPSFAAAFSKAADIKYQNHTLSELLQSGKASFNLYLEIMTAALNNITSDEFFERTSSSTGLPENVNREILSIFSSFELTAILTRRSSFFHIDTLPGFLESAAAIRRADIHPFYGNDFEELRVLRDHELTVYNSAGFKIPATRHKPVIAEGILNSSIEYILGDNILCGMRNVNADLTIPEKICIDQRHIQDFDITMVYGLYDNFSSTNPSDLKFCGQSLDNWLLQRGLTKSNIFSGDCQPMLSNAKLFIKNTPMDFLHGYWSIANVFDWKEIFIKSDRFSIDEINQLTDSLKRDDDRQEIRSGILRKKILDKAGWANISFNDFSEAFKTDTPIEQLVSIYNNTGDPLLRSYRKQHLETLTGNVYENMSEREPFLSEIEPVYKICSPITDRIVTVCSPLRIDISGGWTDTPPFTFKHGGAVVNAAIDLNGKAPVQVFGRLNPESKEIRLFSIDKSKMITVSTFEDLDLCIKSNSIFSIPAAVLIFTGFGKYCGFESLQSILNESGHGIDVYFSTGVPGGSGLGASSILASAVQACILKLYGREPDKGSISECTLKIEQTFGNGGGWQDQIGGIEGGLKYITSKPGLFPRPVIHRLDDSLFVDSDKSSLFTLFYTGLSRQSGDIFSEITAKMNLNSPSIIFSLKYLKFLAENASDALSRRDIKCLSEIINKTWTVNKIINPDASNESVERLLSVTRSYYNSVKFTGAGGGGFVLFISDDKETAGQLREKLSTYSLENSRIEEFVLNKYGMITTVS